MNAHLNYYRRGTGQFTDWHLQVIEQVAAMSLCTDCVLLMTKLPHVITLAVVQSQVVGCILSVRESVTLLTRMSPAHSVTEQ